MFLNSTPASILWARPKSISFILGKGVFLSKSIMFSGCRRQEHVLSNFEHFTLGGSKTCELIFWYKKERKIKKGKNHLWKAVKNGHMFLYTA